MQEQKEITAHLMGGLGNLLFIIATCFALSKKYKVKLRFYCNASTWRDSKRRMMQYYKMFEKFDIDCVNHRKSGITFREPYFFMTRLLLTGETIVAFTDIFNPTSISMYINPNL